MNRIKLFLASALLVNASMQLNGAAHEELKLKKNCEGAAIVIFVHNSNEDYEGTRTSDIITAVKKLHKTNKMFAKLLTHEVDAAKHDTSNEYLAALKTAYEQAGARAVKIVYPENHTLEFLQELNSQVAAPNSRGFDIHQMEEDVQDVVKFANENSEQIHGALEGATALGDIIQKQSAENAALPPAQKRKWYQRAGACICTAAQDPKVQEGVVDAAKLALQLAMMFA
ncbi:hypothetical protein IPF37_01785 [bacterium]|nr:MAG: hypothetical protein IPF37_01785 [bacterium]